MTGLAVGKMPLAVGTGVAAVCTTFFGIWWYLNKYLKNKPPSKWLKIGEIAELYIYPMKSFKAMKTDSLECTPCGPRIGPIKDRIFAVLEENGKLATVKVYPRLSQIEPKYSDSVYTLSSPDMDTEIKINEKEIRGEPRPFMIWGSLAEGIDCGDEVAAWLSQCILKEPSGLRLVYCSHQDKAKTVNPSIFSMSKLNNVELNESDGGYFSDDAAYHLVSEISTQHSSSRTNGEVIIPLNFRPNFVVKGDNVIPFEEDTWTWIRIGDVVFRNISPCSRCVGSAVNPETGVRSETLEPLTSLRRYRLLRDPKKRKVLSNPTMGVYLGLRSAGKVFVGDDVFIPDI